jgi:hypothetical protein
MGNLIRFSVSNYNFFILVSLNVMKIIERELIR